MKAIVTEAFRGAPDGEFHARDFRPGDKITGDLARAMVLDGRAQWDRSAPENAALSVPEKKTGGPTGADERLSSRQAGLASDKKTSRRRKGARSLS